MNKSLKFIADLCFNSKSTKSGHMLGQILCEYRLKSIDNCDIFTVISSLNHHYDNVNDISNEEWKIDMIFELLDCINNVAECSLSNEDCQLILDDLCTM